MLKTLVCKQGPEQQMTEEQEDDRSANPSSHSVDLGQSPVSLILVLVLGQGSIDLFFMGSTFARGNKAVPSLHSI